LAPRWPRPSNRATFGRLLSVSLALDITREVYALDFVYRLPNGKTQKVRVMGVVFYYDVDYWVSEELTQITEARLDKEEKGREVVNDWVEARSTAYVASYDATMGLYI